MKPVFAAGLLLLLACIGAACVRNAMQWLSLLALLVFCQAISFAALPTACYPASEPTDQLAALIAKVLCRFPVQQ